MEGLSQLIQTYQRIRRGLNPELQIAGILLTMFDKRTNLSHQVAADAEAHFKELVFNTIIPRNVRLGESHSFGKWTKPNDNGVCKGKPVDWCSFYLGKTFQLGDLHARIEVTRG